MSSLEAILEHAPAKSIELIAPRPLLMIPAKNMRSALRIPFVQSSPALESLSGCWNWKVVTIQSIAVQAPTRPAGQRLIGFPSTWLLRGLRRTATRLPGDLMGLVVVIAGWLSIGGRHLNRSSHEGNTLPSIRRSGRQVDEGRLPPLTDPGLHRQ